MRIFLVRHGESVANLDGRYYGIYHDPNVPLTQWGWEQAQEAGEALKAYCESTGGIKKPLRLWHSPFKRTRHTTDGLLEAFQKGEVHVVQEDPLLREQDYGIFGVHRDPEEQKKHFPYEYDLYRLACDNNGKYYAPLPMGESPAQVTDRLRTFITQQIERNIEAGHEDMVIVAHGASIRSLIMAFMGYTPEWFEQINNPPNGSIIKIEGDLKDLEGDLRYARQEGEADRGFTVELIHEGKQRGKHMPKDYKSKPYGEEAIEIPEEQLGLFGRLRQRLRHPRVNQLSEDAQRYFP